MLSSLVNVFKIPELRNKILFTLGMLVVYRIGFWIPLPGVSQEALKSVFDKARESGSAFGRLADFVAIFSGGAFSHSTIFGLGIMPYISAGIIIQLFGTVSPQIKKLQEEGPTGRQKIMEWTRYGAVALAVVQAVMWLSYITKLQIVYPQFIHDPVWWSAV